MSKEVYIVERRKDKSGWWTILAAAAIMTLWKWLIFAGVIVCIAWLIRRAWRSLQEHKARKISREAAIALRADHEHRMALAGDPLGIYGQYSPATMPMTQGLVPLRPNYYHDGVHERLDDYNDGLKDWK